MANPIGGIRASPFIPSSEGQTPASTTFQESQARLTHILQMKNDGLSFQELLPEYEGLLLQLEGALESYEQDNNSLSQQQLDTVEVIRKELQGEPPQDLLELDAKAKNLKTGLNDLLG